MIRRSEILQEIIAALKCAACSDPDCLAEKAEAVLTVVEDAGMLPPCRGVDCFEAHHKDCDNEWREEKIGQTNG